MYSWVTRARSLMRICWHWHADAQTYDPSGAPGRGALSGCTRQWAAPLSRAVKSCTGNWEQVSSLSTNRWSQMSVRRGKWFINTSSSQPDGSELCKTNTNHTPALGRACGVTPFCAWCHYYPYCTECIWTTLRDAILVLPTPHISCPKKKNVVLTSATATALWLWPQPQDEASVHLGSTQELVPFFSICGATVSRPAKDRRRKKFPLHTEWKYRQSVNGS